MEIPNTHGTLDLNSMDAQTGDTSSRLKINLMAPILIPVLVKRQ